MAKGIVLCQGDRTTCGGKITAGSAHGVCFSKPAAREGDPVTCGKDGKLYRIVGGISFATSGADRKRLAGSLDSYSNCPCKAKILPSNSYPTYNQETPPTIRQNSTPTATRQSEPAQHAQAAHARKPTTEALPDTCACNRDITLAEFRQIATGAHADKLQPYLNAINKYFPLYGINTCREKAHFLAQACGETGHFRTMKESGGEKQKYAPLYGRGIMQLTHDKNYIDYGNYIGSDFITPPNFEKVADLPYSFSSGYWFYCINTKCSHYAKKDDFNKITAIINGGFNGYNERLSLFRKIAKLLRAEHLAQLEVSGRFPFETSDIYNNPVQSKLWGKWHDPKLPAFAGTWKNQGESDKGYSRYKELEEEKNAQRKNIKK